MKIDNEKIKKILVVNLGGIGDNLLSMPALKSLRRLFPHAHIAILTLRRSCELMEKADCIDEAIPLSAGFTGQLMGLRKNKFDMIINMRTLASLAGAVKMALIFAAINAKCRVGRDTMGRGFFLNVKIPESYPGKKHDMEYDLDLVRALGGSTDGAKLELEPAGGDIDFVDELLRKQGVRAGEVLVGISPGAPFPSRRWPLKNFIDVGNRLSEAGYKVIIMGGKDEIYLKDELKQAGSPDFLTAVGETDLWQFAALVKRCSINIVNDTGAMHIAAAVGARLVAILGPGNIENYDPRKITKNATVFYKRADCSPCEKVYCDSMKCLEAVSASEVADKCLGILRKPEI